MTTCSDCGTQYADDAPYCPNCGKPNPARQQGGTSAPGDLGGASGGGNPVGGGAPAGNTYGGGTPGGGFTSGSGSGYGTGSGFGTGGTGTPGGTPGGAGQGAPGGGFSSGPAGGGYSTGQAGGGFSGGSGAGYSAGGGGAYTGGPAAGGAPQNIPNYLVQAILVTLCCCLPVGIVSIIYATQVNTKRDSGDIAGALEASKNAKKWAIIGAVAGVIWLAIILAFNGLAFIMALASGGQSS